MLKRKRVLVFCGHASGRVGEMNDNVGLTQDLSQSVYPINVFIQSMFVTCTH